MTEKDLEDQKETIMEFPCDFEVKAMGKNQPEFADHVLALVSSHVSLSDIRVTTKPSRNEAYLSVRCEFSATSKTQLDAIYQSLSDDSKVLVAL